MRKEAIFALVGFLVGAATLAGGDDEGDLREELERLQREAARAMQRNWEANDLPPSDGSGNQVGFFPLEDLGTPRYDVLPPTHDLVLEGSESPLFGGYAEEGQLPFGTNEEVMELIRVSVDPAAWETGIVTLAGDSMVVASRPSTVGRVRTFLDRTLRRLAHRGVAMDFEAVDVSAAMGRSLSGADAGRLFAEARAKLDNAISTGAAQRVFGLKGIGSLGTRFVVWHGREVAIVSDFDVEVAQTASTADPVVAIVQSGGYIATRAEVDDSGRNISLDLGLRLEELLGIRRHETRRSGVVDLPERTEQANRLAVRVPNGVWTIASSGTTDDGKQRLFLVRASLIERGGDR